MEGQGDVEVIRCWNGVHCSRAFRVSATLIASHYAPADGVTYRLGCSSII